MLRSYLSLPPAVHLLCLGSFVNRAGTFVVVFLTLYLTTQLRMGVTFATRTMGLFGLGAVMAAGVGGHLADHFGRRIVMLTALLCGGAVLLVLSFTITPWRVMLLVGLFGFISEMYRPAASAMIADLTLPKQRSHAFGLMYVSINLGFAVGAYVGGLISRHDFHWLFWGDAITSALYATLIFFFIRETLPARILPAAVVLIGAPIPAGGARAGAALTEGASLRDAARHILTNYPFLVFCVGNFFIALVFMQAMTTFPVYLELKGFTSDDYGTVIALNGLLIVLLQLPLTSVLNRFHRGSVVVAATVLNAVGFGLTGTADTLWQFALTIVIWTMGEMSMAPYGPAIVSDFAPASLRARYMGVYGMSFSSAMMLAAPLGGEILGRPSLGGWVLWLSAFVLSMIAAMLYLSIRRHLAR